MGGFGNQGFGKGLEKFGWEEETNGIEWQYQNVSCDRQREWKPRKLL